MRTICIGNGSKDIFFPIKQAEIIESNGKKMLTFEYKSKTQIEDRFEAPGGCAVNLSQGLAKLGVETACYCRIGSDPDGDWIAKNLESADVDISLIQRDKDYKTDMAVIIVNEAESEATILFNRDANEQFEVKSEEIEAEWVFVASSLSGDWKGNLDKIKEAAKVKNIKLAYNPGQSNMREDLEKVKEFISGADVLFVNKKEAKEIIGEKTDDVKILLEKLRALDVKVAAITDGDSGAFASNGAMTVFVPALKEKAVDSTGAGDAFASAFLASFIQGKNLDECLKRGIANGGSVVNFYGAQKGLLDEETITKKIEGLQGEEI